MCNTSSHAYTLALQKQMHIISMPPLSLAQLTATLHRMLHQTSSSWSGQQRADPSRRTEINSTLEQLHLAAPNHIFYGPEPELSLEKKIYILCVLVLLLL